MFSHATPFPNQLRKIPPFRTRGHLRILPMLIGKASGLGCEEKRRRPAIKLTLPTTCLSLHLALFLATTSAAENQTNKSGAQPPAINAPPGFVLKSGFRMESVAAEPLLAAPVAIACDEANRLFVVERPERTPWNGRIRLLQDTDASGNFNASSVFAEEVPWASAIACYDGGVFVAAGTEILYLKDTTGKGIANVRKTIFSGFADGLTNRLNQNFLINNFNWGLDNRIHAAAAGIGGLITSSTQNGSVTLDRDDFSFDPRTLTFDPEVGPSESGL